MLIVFILVSYCGFSQQLTSTISDEVDYDISDIGPSILQIGHDVLFANLNNDFRLGGNIHHYSMALGKINRATNVISINNLNGGKRIYYYYITPLHTLNNKPYYLYFADAPGTQLGNLMAAEIDTASLTVSNAKTVAEIGGMRNRIKLTEHDRFYLHSNFTTSANGKRSAACFVTEKGKYFVSVIDENLNILGTSEGAFGGGKKIDVQKSVVDNNGTVYVAYRVVDNSTVLRGGDIHIFMVRQNGSSADILFGKEEVIPKEVFFVLSKDGKYMRAVSWYYAWEPNGIRGVYCSNINTGNLAVDSTAVMPLPQEVVDKMSEQGFGYKDKKGIGIYGQMETFVTIADDGSINITGTPSTAYRNSVVKVPDDYSTLSGNIVNVNFGGANPARFRVIPREVAMPNSDEGVHLFVTSWHGKTIAIYNDAKDNIGQDINLRAKKYTGFGSIGLVAAIINADGSVNRQLVGDLTNESFLPDASFTFQLSTGEILTAFYRIKQKNGKIKNGVRFGTVRVN